MRSERRHELEQNILADWMAESVKAVRPYANLILAVVLAALIVTVAAVLWIQNSRMETARSWEDFYTAASSGSQAELSNVIEQYPGKDAAWWAAVVAGDQHLAEGCELLFANKADANEELTKAIDRYRGVLQQNKIPSLRERATFGLARAWEARGDLEKAQKNYKTVVSQWPESPYAEIAQLRLTDLNRPATKQFYDRFAKFDPAPSFSEEPGTPGQRPEFDAESLAPPPGEALPGLETAAEKEEPSADAEPKSDEE